MQNREYQFYVYILSSRSRDLYIGMTNNLRLRVSQHREMKPGTYTAQYNIHRLGTSSGFSTSAALSLVKRS